MALSSSLLRVDSYSRTSLLSPLQQQTQSGFHGQQETPRRLRLSMGWAGAEPSAAMLRFEINELEVED
jgi:hypothetical protein